MCNTIYKIISKLILNRIKPHLNNIFHPHQKGPSTGRQIIYFIQTIHEAMHSMEKSKIESMILKLDISKSYGTVSWDFLLVTLRKVSFDGKCLSLIESDFDSHKYY